MERPPESMKSFANRIARIAYSGNSALTLRLLRLAGLVGGSSDINADKAAARILTDSDMSRRSAAPENPEHIGIWERKIENGRTCFVRRLETMPEWHYWANLGRIDAKGSKRRVVFIGESVARGYLYDPQFTPAMALQQILEPQFGGEIEVIDLARTNLSYEVRELAIAALQLEPDVIIIFSGNNWSISFPGPAELAQTDEAISKDGIVGAKRVSEEQIGRNAKRIVNDVAAACASKGVPLVWIVPEFNLGDWRDPITNAPHLAEGLNKQWLLLLDEAQSALRDRDFARAEELAHKMHAIDQGVCVATLYILADCCKHKQDLEAERKHLELGRDALVWDSSRMVMPRPYSVMQDTVRREARERENYVVDVPALFKEYLHGEIPGRRMFLDYCHMTTEGIQVTMAAAASCVLRALKGVEVPWYALGAERIAPSRETEAEASFLAAVHSAHWWQPYDIARYFCKRALALSPHLSGLMINYMELQTRRLTPMLMSASEEAISKGSAQMSQYLLRANEKRLDRLLLDGVVEALEEAGINGRERLDALRREEHSVANEPTNLLEYYYCSAADQPQELSWLLFSDKGYRLNETDYYKAYWPTSKFIFVGEAGCPVQLSLTCRLPKTAAEEATIGVDFNGKPQVSIVVSNKWSSWEISLPGVAVRGSLNEIAVRWPMPAFPYKAGLEKVMTDLCNRRFPEFYPVFGEIHSFKAANGHIAATIPPALEEELAAVEIS